MVWKRWRRHDGTHDLDMKVCEIDGEVGKISSMISCGSSGIMTALISAEVGSFASEVFKSIRGGCGWGEGWALFLV